MGVHIAEGVYSRDQEAVMGVHIAEGVYSRDQESVIGEYGYYVCGVYKYILCNCTISY